MNFLDIVAKAVEKKASDIHIAVGIPPSIRVNGTLQYLGDTMLTPNDTVVLIKQALKGNQMETLVEKGEVDTSFTAPGGRLRINAFRQRDVYSMAIRIINSEPLTVSQLGLPPIMSELARKRRGLILVTGPTGSGKSTTLAAMLDQINEEKRGHIVTLEDPIEYLHKHKQCVVNQREIGFDSENFTNALRASLRQDPDVILVGEMRDLETISIAITAAETGHLVLSTLHTLGSAKTIDRIIDVFPPHQQQQVQTQLASVIEGVISQQLLPTADGKGRTVALEIMTATPALRSMIRDGKTHQIQNVLQTGQQFGMTTMDGSLLDLYNRGKITRQDLMDYSIDEDSLTKLMGNTAGGASAGKSLMR